MNSTNILREDCPTSSHFFLDGPNSTIDELNNIGCSLQDYENQETQLNHLMLAINQHFLLESGTFSNIYGLLFDKNIKIGLSSSSTLTTTKGIDQERNWHASKVNALRSLFEKESVINKAYIKDVETVAFNKVYKAISKIASLNYEKTALELTPDTSVFFNIHLSKVKKLHIEVYFCPKGGESKEAFYSLYENKKCINNGGGSIEEVVGEVSELLR